MFSKVGEEVPQALVILSSCRATLSPHPVDAAVRACQCSVIDLIDRTEPGASCRKPQAASKSERDAPSPRPSLPNHIYQGNALMLVRHSVD